MGCGASAPAELPLTPIAPAPPVDPAPAPRPPPLAEPEPPEQPGLLALTAHAWLTSFAPSTDEQTALAPVRSQCVALGVSVASDLALLSKQDMREIRAELKAVPRRKLDLALTALLRELDTTPPWAPLESDAVVDAAAKAKLAARQAEEVRPPPRSAVACEF